MLSTDFLMLKTKGGGMTYILSFLLLFLTVNTGSAQESISCNGELQVSLGQDCQAVITPQMLLQGENENDPTFNPALYTVSILGLNTDTVSTVGTFRVSVTRISDGNNCWSTIHVEDKLPPRIISCGPCSIDSIQNLSQPICQLSCSSLDTFYNNKAYMRDTLAPKVADDRCSHVVNEYVYDDINDDDNCADRTITRTWIFEDENGRKSTCVQKYQLIPTRLNDIILPQRTVILGCDNDLSPESVRNVKGVSYAYPSVNGQPLKVGVHCNLAIHKSDTGFDICDAECSKSKKIIREWTIIDWCATGAPNDPKTIKHIQILKSYDTIPPIIRVQDTLIASTDPWSCKGTFYFPKPSLFTDNCTDHEHLEYIIRAPHGGTVTWDNNKGQYKATDAPKGIFPYIYEGTDCCDNIGRDTIYVNVRDLVAPVPVAKEFITVTLTNSSDAAGGGLAKIKPESVDNGSHDFCGPVHLEIRRDSDNCSVTGNTTYNNDGHKNDSNADTDDGQFVKFCCEDVTALENDVNGDGVKDAGYVKVWLRVWDDGDMDGTFGSAGDNYNETWAYVKVENKVLPTMTCPSDITIGCDDDENDLSVTGEPNVYSACGHTLKYKDTENKNMCNTTITRTWYLEEYGINAVNCKQTIYKVYRDTFFGSNITWPVDTIVNCTNTYIDDVPTWNNVPPCAQLGYSLVSSDTFIVEVGACKKIINNWAVMDWCQYSINNLGYETGIWRHSSIIKVIDNEAPVVTCTDTMYAVNDHNDYDKDGVKCEGKNLHLKASAIDNGACSSAWLKWIVKIDLYGDGKYDLTKTATSTPNEDVLISLPDIPGTMDTHKVYWSVSDGCGNVGSCSSTFMVVDKKAPTPYCVHISSALMQNGQVDIWAKDFNKGSFDNCTAKDNLRYTFSSTPPSQDSEYIDLENSSSMTFTCAEIAESNIVNVDVYVWDEKNLYDYCSVELTLVDNQGSCSQNNNRNHVITGTISSSKGAAMKDVQVKLDAAIAEYPKTTMTDKNGTYAFNVIEGMDYQITASKNDNVLSGVNTLDIALIQRHILEIKSFKDVYQVIAADVNNDQKLSADDLLALRKVILGIDVEFPNDQQSYLVVDAETQSENMLNPWPLTKDINVENMHKSVNNKNLTIVKIGDVNRDADEVDSRSNKVFALEYETIEEKTHVYASNDVSLAGFQLAIDLRNANLIALESDKLKISSDMYTVKDGKLYISTTSVTNTNIRTGEELFTVVTDKSSAINLDKGTFANQAYIGDKLTTANVTMRSRTEEIFSLAQNEPNPFKDATTIAYTLPVNAMITLSVYDLSGREVYSKNIASHRGYNTVNLNMKGQAAGVYYYTVQSDEYTATNKMIIVK